MIVVNSKQTSLGDIIQFYNFHKYQPNRKISNQNSNLFLFLTEAVGKY
jgi:hypothetical protein